MITTNIVLIRYSLLLEDLKGWLISRTDIETYKKTLFDNERLKERLNLFLNLTLPSLVNQKLINERIEGTNIHSFQVILVTSEDLPDSHKVEIDNIASQYSWLSIKYIPSTGVRITSVITNYIEKLYSEVKKPILYSSIRLDDDDALSVDFLDQLKSYVKEENIGRAITFPNGYYAVYDNELKCFKSICDMFHPKLALGLAFVNKYDERGYADEIKTIYGAGNHIRIDRRVPVISDGRLPSYIRTVHTHADSHSERGIKRTLDKSNHVHIVKVMQSIGITFPAFFAGLQLNITKDELEKIKVHEFNLKNKKLEIDLIIQICFWKDKMLIQLSKYNSENQYLNLLLRRSDIDLTKESTISSGESQILVSLEDNTLMNLNYDSESNIYPLSLDISLSIKDKLYKHTFEF